MARPAAKYKAPPAPTGPAPASRRKRAEPSSGSAPEHVERNRAAWERWAPGFEPAARRAWKDEELRWGIWGLAESELQLLTSLELDTDVVELGCGTATVSAWLARHGARPVAVDFARAQIDAVGRLQLAFGVPFRTVCGNAEKLEFDDESFDLAISEYGVSLWSEPDRWLPEAHRLLRPGGRLIFVTNSAFLMACTPSTGGRAEEALVRDYFSMAKVEFDEEDAVEFHPTHGEWVRALVAAHFVLEDLIEVRPPPNAVARFDFASLDWARSWPSEEIWVARKAG